MFDSKQHAIQTIRHTITIQQANSQIVFFSWKMFDTILKHVIRASHCNHKHLLQVIHNCQSTTSLVHKSHRLINWDFHLAVLLKIYELFSHGEVKKYWSSLITWQLKRLKQETLPQKTNLSSIQAKAQWMHGSIFVRKDFFVLNYGRYMMLFSLNGRLYGFTA